MLLATTWSICYGDVVKLNMVYPNMRWQFNVECYTSKAQQKNRFESLVLDRNTNHGQDQAQLAVYLEERSSSWGNNSVKYPLAICMSEQPSVFCLHKHVWRIYKMTMYFIVFMLVKVVLPVDQFSQNFQKERLSRGQYLNLDKLFIILAYTFNLRCTITSACYKKKWKLNNSKCKNSSNFMLINHIPLRRLSSTV